MFENPKSQIIKYLQEKRKAQYEIGRFHNSESIVISFKNGYVELYKNKPVRINVLDGQVEYICKLDGKIEKLILNKNNTLEIINPINNKNNCIFEGNIAYISL